MQREQSTYEMKEKGEYLELKRLNGYECYGMGVGGLPKIKNP